MASVLAVTGLAGCHLLAGYDDLEATGVGGAGGTTASGTGGSTSSGGGGGGEPMYTVGGEVTGLDGQVTLSNDGQEDLVVTAPGSFVFPTSLPSAASYVVSVAAQPSQETCSVTNGSGDISGEDIIDILVDCRGDSAELSGLTTTAGATNPLFNPSTFSYSMVVESLVATLVVTPTAADPNAEIRVNEVALPSGTPSEAQLLGMGQGTTIPISVTSESGNYSETYTLNVSRAGPLSTMPTYMKAFNTGSNDQFGTAVAVSGNTVVVGAPGEGSDANVVDGDETDDTAPGAGAAYVFVYTGTAWTQQAYLKASNSDPGDAFGKAVAISGDTIVVGAWAEASNGTENDNSAGYSGAAYVFVRNGSTWTQQAYLKAFNSEASDYFGLSLDISGDAIVIGAYQESSADTGVNGTGQGNGSIYSGAAYVFVRNGTTWTHEAYLKASNTDPVDHFGQAVAIHHDTIVVGAANEASGATTVDGDENDNGTGAAGAAYVFVRTGSTWAQEAYLKASNTGPSDAFGGAVDVFGDHILVGAIGEDGSLGGVNATENNSAQSAGAAYLFTRSGSSWVQTAYVKPVYPDSTDSFGKAVALSDQVFIVGAWQEDSNMVGPSVTLAGAGADNSGASYVFTFDGSDWFQMNSLKASNTGADDLFGHSVAIDGELAVVGAFREASSADQIGGNGVLNDAAAAGAAYVYQ